MPSMWGASGSTGAPYSPVSVLKGGRSPAEVRSRPPVKDRKKLARVASLPYTLEASTKEVISLRKRRMPSASATETERVIGMMAVPVESASNSGSPIGTAIGKNSRSLLPVSVRS